MYTSTQRLILRPIEETDMAQMLDMLESDAVGKTYMIPDFPSRADAVRLARRFIELSHRQDRVVAGIALEGMLIGFINDVGITDGRIELGYAIHPEHHGCGYMTEALGAVIDELFSNGYHEIIAGAFSQNAASIRVMEKCGMQRLDKRDEIEYRGKRHECVYYAIGLMEG